MLGISTRIIQAHQAASPTKHEEDQERVAGRQGEEKFIDLLQKHGGVYSCNLFARLRIPDQFQTRRHEIDLIVITGYGIYCIEVKNWGGKISPSNDPLYWEQIKSANFSKFSKQVQYFNPINETKKKADVLRNHLMRAGICISESKFFSHVILMNQNCDLSEEISSNPCVITHDKLQEFATSFNRTYAQIVTDPFIPYFIRGQLSYTQMDQIRSALCQIGTWDVLHLNGGRQLVGDYKGCVELSFNRKDVEEINFVHQRNATTASIWAVLGYAPTATVQLYKRNGAGWFKREITASVTIPYNLDIVFRIAGESTDAKIPANDINNIILSS